MVVFGIDGDSVSVKEDLSGMVADLANAKKVVLEGRHAMTAAGGKVGQIEVGRGRGGVDAAGGIAYMGCGSVRVDVAYWGGGSDVYVTSTCVGDCCVCDG